MIIIFFFIYKNKEFYKEIIILIKYEFLFQIWAGLVHDPQRAQLQQGAAQVLQLRPGEPRRRGTHPRRLLHARVQTLNPRANQLCAHTRATVPRCESWNPGRLYTWIMIYCIEDKRTNSLRLQGLWFAELTIRRYSSVLNKLIHSDDVHRVISVDWNFDTLLIFKTDQWRKWPGHVVCTSSFIPLLRVGAASSTFLYRVLLNTLPLGQYFYDLTADKLLSICFIFHLLEEK